jgi:predicted amidophosphoribosyltransferase
VRALLAKVRETRDQAALSAAQRRMNQDGAFRTLRALGPGRIALVDDIITTGATAEACALALREAGAAEVVVVAFARTP